MQERAGAREPAAAPMAPQRPQRKDRRRPGAAEIHAPGQEPPERVNTNWLPKLEPYLNACILTGVMLFGLGLI